MARDADDVHTDAYDRVSVGTYGDGSPVLLNKRTKAMLEEAEKRLGYSLTIAQGSYHTTTSQSAGTHDGGGAVDLVAFEADRKVRVLREVGFAAWHRLPSEGDWPEHVHAVALGDRDMSPEARSQVSDYKNGRNGLASHAKDSAPRPKPIPFFSYFKHLKREQEARRRAARKATQKPPATKSTGKKAPGKKASGDKPGPQPAGRATPNRDAIERAALRGLAQAETPEVTRFFAGILEQVRKGPDKPLRKRSAELGCKPHAKEEVRVVSPDAAAGAATPRSGRTGSTAMKAAGQGAKPKAAAKDTAKTARKATARRATGRGA